MASTFSTAGVPRGFPLTAAAIAAAYRHGDRDGVACDLSRALPEPGDVMRRGVERLGNQTPRVVAWADR